MLDRLYARFGTGYVALVLGWLAVLALAGGGLSAVVATRLLALSFDPEWDLVGMVEGAIAVGCGIPFALLWRDVDPLVGWIRDDRPEPGAPEAWQAGVTAIRRAWPRCFALVSVLLLPAVLWAVHRYRLGPGGFPVAWLFAQFGIAVTAVYMAFVGEAMLRPMVADAASAVPARGVGSPTVHIRRRVLLALAVTTSFAVLVSQAVGSVGHSASSRMLGAVVLAALIALTFTPVLIRVVADSVVGPVRTLTEATALAAAGDLDHPVPVASLDELGALATSFNAMLEGLREREALQSEQIALAGALQAALAEAQHRAGELRASRARVVAASDVERRRMERDLHDGAQQQLLLLGLELARARRLIEPDPASAAAAHDRLQAGLDAALAQLRDLAHGIYPAVLEREGLPAALREAAARSEIPVAIECDDWVRQPSDLETAIYFCCLEALQNAAKHAGSGARVTLRLAQGPTELAFAVCDDGRGFDTAAVLAGVGRQNMADRIGALGGSLTVQSAPGCGTTVAGSVPVEHADAGPRAPCQH